MKDWQDKMVELGIDGSRRVRKRMTIEDGKIRK